MCIRDSSSIIELPLNKIISILENKRKNESYTSISSESNNLSYELDLRGFSVIEVKDVLEKFLDNSILNNEKRCQIFHGIGSRSIENEVHRILKEISFVDSFMDHKERRGVTEVYFK